jgi:hypothetical protein
MEVIKFMLLLTAKLLVFIVSSVVIGFLPIFSLVLTGKVLAGWDIQMVYSNYVMIWMLSVIFSVGSGILIHAITSEQFNSN